MSLFSRWFRKAPPVPAAPASARPETLPPKPGAAERAQAAAADEQALQSAIDARDVQAIGRLVVAGASTRIRQAAAHAVEDPDLLRQLIREVRGGKDNSVYRILAAKRDVLLEQVRKHEQAQAEIAAAAEALERHSRTAFDVLFAPRLEQLELRWNAVAGEARAESSERVRQSIDRAREVIAEHERQVQAQAERERVAAEERRLREEQAQAQAAAAAEHARAVEEERRALAEKQHAEQEAIREIGDSIRKARAALGGGSSARAAGLRRAIDEKLAGAPPLPPSLVSQLQQLDKQIAELKDWRSFSVAPKRIELIEAMESLVGAPLEPPALAEEIKRLQEQWRTLSKGAAESDDADWQRFHAAGQKAYEPCSEYFAAQALVREENLRKRDALVERLAAFDAEQDWEQPDWKAVVAVLREVKQAWRNCMPVDHRAGRAQQDKFSALVKSVQGRLDAEHARNVQQKEALIERATQFVASDDVRKAIDGVKDLQQKWRTVGPVPREADQRLWERFREQCDAAFDRRQAESAAYAASLEGNKAQAIGLCEQVEAIASLEGPELQSRIAALGELRRAFEALGEFPRSDTRAIRTRFERALERCDEAQARQKARDAERSWDDLFAAAGHVRAWRLAVARGADGEQVANAKQAAESFVAGVARWPKGGFDAIQQALAAEPSTDLAANESAARLLCVRAEILADLPTPPEDQALRREHQLQRLVQGMGQRARADEPQLEQLALEWVRTGPVDDAAYAPLAQRFRQALSRREQKIPASRKR